MKKFLALFLICVLVVSMLCVGVLAADTPSPEGQVEPPVPQKGRGEKRLSESPADRPAALRLTSASYTYQARSIPL